MKTLSDKLRIVADKLETGAIEFDWSNAGQCCCGVVAQMLLGKTQMEISKAVSDMDKMAKCEKGKKYWKSYVSKLCPMTGRPNVEILGELYDAGLTGDDIAHLEYLSDPKVLKLSKPKMETHTIGMLWWKEEVSTKIAFSRIDAKDVAAYIRGLALLKESVQIEEERPEPAPSRIHQFN